MSLKFIESPFTCHPRFLDLATALVTLEKIFLKFLLVVDYFSKITNSVIKNNHLPAWIDFKINFSRPLLTIIVRPKNLFLHTDSILRVKTLYESVK